MPGILLQAEGGSLVQAMLPFLLIFAIFYFLVIRPQSRKQKEHTDMLAAIERGDSVVTSGGLHGRVVGVTDDVLTLEVASTKSDRIRLKVDRARIERKLESKGGDDS